MKLISTIAILAVAALSSAQSFTDNFNRSDGGLGANYTTQSGSVSISGNAVVGGNANGLTLVNSGVFTGAYNQTTVSADVSVLDQSSTLTYDAISLGSDGNGAVNHGIFVKLQRQAAGGFGTIGFYTGAGNNGNGITTSGGNFQTLATTFNSAHLTIKTLDATTLYTGIDTDFNGVDDITYLSTLNLGTLILGNQVGLHVWGTTSHLDNFSAVVPEPVSMAAFGLGALALLRRRRHS